MREPEAFFDDPREAELYEAAIEVLVGAGYEHYEVSNFARPGHRCRHNLNYWRNGEYRGFGVGAASYRDGVRWTTTRRLDAYIDAVCEGSAPEREEERLEGARRAGEAAMLALRTSDGIDAAAFSERYGVDFFAFYRPIVAQLRDDGLIDVDETTVRLTRRGRFLANDVCGAFVTFG